MPDQILEEVEGVYYYTVKTRTADGKETSQRIPLRGNPKKEASNIQEKIESKRVDTEVHVPGDKGRIHELVELTRYNKGKVIVEVGCGDKLSISLGRNDLWIGVDPDLPQDRNTVDRGDNKVYSASSRLLCKEYLGDLPEFSPDLVLMVAPNPADILDRLILNDVLERVAGDKTRILLILDTQSYESILNPKNLQYDGDGLEEIKQRVEETFDLENYEIEVEPWYDDVILSDDMKEISGINNPAYINSSFLQGQEKLIIAVRKK